MQDANDFINFGHNAINNLQMPSDKAQHQEQAQAMAETSGRGEEEAQQPVAIRTLSHGPHVSWYQRSELPLSALPILNAMVAISRENYQLAKLMLIT
ncbi:hypothetical protein ACLKA6_010895 [Drosophila palustris]